MIGQVPGLEWGQAARRARGKTREEEARIIAQEFASYGLQACARPSDDLARSWLRCVGRATCEAWENPVVGSA
jgi:hypothetical protein